MNEITGKVRTGVGRGAYFVEMYYDKLVEMFGFKPFLGTLNLEVNELKASNMISSSHDDFIEEFEIDRKSYGAVHCYKVFINDKTEGVILVPERAGHSNKVIELISEEDLRKLYNLKNNDEVRVSVRN